MQASSGKLNVSYETASSRDLDTCTASLSSSFRTLDKSGGAGEDSTNLSKSLTHLNSTGTRRGRELKRSTNNSEGQSAGNLDYSTKSTSYIDYLAEMDGFCIVELLQNGEAEISCGNSGDGSLVSEGEFCNENTLRRRHTTSGALANNDQVERRTRRGTSVLITPSVPVVSETEPPKKHIELWGLVAQGINITISKFVASDCRCFLQLNLIAFFVFVFQQPKETSVQ